jgi:hypothetical protein
LRDEGNTIAVGKILRYKISKVIPGRDKEEIKADGGPSSVVVTT